MGRTAPSTLPCVHRWDIAEAHGPKSPGKCVHCGAVREFANVINPEAAPFNFNRHDRENLDGYYLDRTRRRRTNVRST